MQEQREKGSTENESGTGSVDAKVIVAIGGSKRDIPCDYPLADFIFQDEYDVNLPAMFNQLKNKSSYDLFVYMSEEYNFASESSLSRMVEKFWSLDMTSIGAVYTDILVKHKDKEICVKVNPAYRSSFYEERIVLNIPFMAKSAILPTFNEEVEQLCLWDGMLWLTQNTLLYHIPETLFQIEDSMELKQIEKEIGIVHGTHY